MDNLPDKLLMVLIAGIILSAIVLLATQLKTWMLSRNNRRQTHDFFEVAADGMALISPKWRCMKVNKSLCNLLGYDASELMSMDFQRIIHPDDFNKDLPHLKKILDGQLHTHHSMQRYLDKNGDLKSLNVYVSAQRDKQGIPRLLISQFRAIHA
jgi:diguanylate cyclase